MAMKFSNYGSALIDVEAAPGHLTITLESGGAALFPPVTTASGDTFQAVMEDISGNWEVVTCTDVNTGTDVLTVTRAQEGTSAKTFPIGSRIEMRLTQEMCAEFIQRSGDVMSGNLDMGTHTIQNAVIDGPTIDDGVAKGTILQDTSGNAGTEIKIPDGGDPTLGGADILTDLTGAPIVHEHFPDDVVQGALPEEQTFVDELISQNSVTQYRDPIIRVPVDNTAVALDIADSNLFRKLRYTGSATVIFTLPLNVGIEGDLIFISNNLGTVLIQPEAGLTLRMRDGQTGTVTLSSHYGVVGMHKTGPTNWEVSGDYE